MDEALRPKAGQQTLCDALLQVQVHRLVGQAAGVREHHRADGRLTPPLRQRLVAAARDTQRVERGGPAPVAVNLPVERWKAPNLGALRRAGRAQRGGAQQLQRAGERVPERLRLEADPAARPVEQGAAALDLLVEISLSGARRLQLLRGNAAAARIRVRLLDLARQLAGVAAADARAEAAFDVVVDHLRQAAELPPDGLGLADQHLKHAVLLALRQHEVVAADLGGRLQLAIDAAVALLDAAGVPRQVEVEQVGAVRLEIEPFAGRVGGQQDAQRLARRIVVEAALDLLAAGAGGQAVDRGDAVRGPVGAGDGRLQHLPQVALGPPRGFP